MKVARFTKAARRSLTAVAGVTLLTMSAAVVAPSAFGQRPKQVDAPAAPLKPATASISSATLALKLKANVKCVEPDAGNQMLINADTAGASLTDLLSALDDVSIDPVVCVQIKDAASALAQQLSQSNPGLDAEQAAAAAERMQQVLAEADQRAASAHFEVGPPPRNLTRNRETFQ